MSINTGTQTIRPGYPGGSIQQKRKCMGWGATQLAVLQSDYKEAASEGGRVLAEFGCSQKLKGHIGEKKLYPRTLYIHTKLRDSSSGKQK